MKVLFVGLSNKPNVEPFDSSTNSGKVVDSIINKLECDCHKVNLVNYAPVNENNKLRYPTTNEISAVIPEFMEFVTNLKPDLIVAFGNVVSNELQKIDMLNCKIIYHKHPSYILVFQRKNLENYISKIVSEINCHNYN